MDNLSSAYGTHVKVATELAPQSCSLAAHTSGKGPLPIFLLIYLFKVLTNNSQVREWVRIPVPRTEAPKMLARYHMYFTSRLLFCLYTQL